MKFTKMSLVAALLIGSSAFALENTKISGNANVFYNTTDGSNGTLFDKASSAADIAVNLNVTTDLLKNDMVAVSAGAGYSVLTTLGLENNFVSNVWGGAHTATTTTGATYGKALGGAKVENASWFNEAWVAATAGKSTVKLGRMELDTPLAFSEKWSIEKNTFDAAVLINQDIPDTTLVGAFVGNGNGTENFGYKAAATKPVTLADVNPAANAQSNVQTNGLAVGPVVNGDGKFTTYGTNGAYAIGAINNSWKPLTAQAWYYDVTRVATAYWLQGDLDLSSLGVDGLTMGAQYTGLTLDDNIAKNADENSATAVMVGYAMKDVFSAKLAYSQTSSDGSYTNVGMNTATSTATAASKLYTEAWWNYGYITRNDTTAYNLTIESPVQGMFDLGLYYTSSTSSVAGSSDVDMSELTLTASKTVGPLDATLAYINTSADDQNNGDGYNSVQAYLTLNF